MRDIRKFSDPRILVAIITAAAAVDTLGMFVWRYTAEPAGPINTWYDKFGVAAYIIDVLSIIIGMVLAQLVSSVIGGPFNLVAFLIIVVAIQMTHDIFFSQIVVPFIPAGHNSIIDLMKTYSTMRGAGWVLGVDAGYMVATTLGALTLLEFPQHITWFTLLSVLYTTGYILFTHTTVQT
jgi:hypothetical protein